MLILLCISLIFAVAKRKKIKRYFVEEKIHNSLMKYNLLKKCYNPGTDFEEIFAQEGFDYDKLNQEAIANTLSKMLDQNFKAAALPKIPTITHKMYFTSNKNHVVLNDFYIEEMRVTYNKLNDLGRNWQHNIWVNQANLIPEDIRSIKGVQVRNVAELKDHPSYNTILNLLDKGRDKKPYLAQAADLFRLIVVQKFGGIYSDMDYELYNPKALFELMERFDFMVARERWTKNSYYGNAFIAAKPNHPILNEALKMSLRNYNNKKDQATPDYIKYPCNGFDELYFNGPPLVTIAYFSKNNINGNTDAILPSWMIFNVSFIRHKYQTMDLYSVTKNAFHQENKTTDKLLAQFIIDPQIIDAHQHDLLVGSKLSDNIYYNLKDRA